MAPTSEAATPTFNEAKRNGKEEGNLRYHKFALKMQTKSSFDLAEFGPVISNLLPYLQQLEKREIHRNNCFW